MSSTYVTLPGTTIQTINGTLYTLNSKPKKIRTSMKGDKKVEVRWLASEADLYVKQWRRRYRQLEGGLDDSAFSWHQSHMLEQCDDWCFTALRHLDINVAYLNAKEYNKFNLENRNQSFDFFFNRNSKLVLNSLENDELELDNYDDFTSFDSFTFDPNVEFNQELIAAFKSNNLIFKNGKLEYNLKKEDSEKEKIVEKPINKKNNKPSSPAEVVVPSSHELKIQPNKLQIKNQRTKVPKMRNRANSNRRQMYICEFPGCSYQSDRNFNFLRHKRTHGKNKAEDFKRSSIISSGEFYNSNKTNINEIHLNETSMNMTYNQKELIMSINSDSTLESNLSSDNTLKPYINNSPKNIAEERHPFLLINTEMNRKIINDSNDLNHLVTDNFSTTTMDQSFMSEHVST